jgi:hypothetical protein
VKNSTAPAWILPEEEAPRPAVSVLIPSQPMRSAMLAECLASLSAQTCQDFEVHISISPHWWGEKITDLAKIARGRYLCVLPDDDMLAPTYIEKTLAAARGGFALIYTDIQFFGDRTDAYDLPDFSVNAQRHACVPWMTSLIRRQLWDGLGGFDPNQILQDSDFYLRAAIERVEAAHVRERLVFARQHPANGAKLMDKDTAALRLQAKHPAFFPSSFLDPTTPAPTESLKNDGYAVVAPVEMPARFRKAAAMGVAL